MKLVGSLTAFLVTAAAAAKPVFLQAVVDGGQVGVRLLDEAFLKSMSVGADVLEKFLTPDLAPYVTRGSERLAEGEEVALMLLTPVSSGSFIMNPVKATESVMNDLVQRGQSLASDVANQPLLEVLPGVVAKVKEGVTGFTPEILPLAAEDAIHDAIETALSGFIGGSMIGSNFISNVFRVTPLGRNVVESVEL